MQLAMLSSATLQLSSASSMLQLSSARSSASARSCTRRARCYLRYISHVSPLYLRALLHETGEVLSPLYLHVSPLYLRALLHEKGEVLSPLYLPCVSPISPRATARAAWEIRGKYGGDMGEIQGRYRPDIARSCTSRLASPSRIDCTWRRPASSSLEPGCCEASAELAVALPAKAVRVMRRL